MRTINRLVVHCSASKPKTPVDINTITRDHLRRGFLKVGYHYVILRNGKVQNGRTEAEVGAHVAGFNSDSIGICMVGGLNDDTGKPEDNFTDEQYETLRHLLTTLVHKYPTVTDVCGHRDLSPDLNKDGKVTSNEWLKACPCFDVRKWWNKPTTK